MHQSPLITPSRAINLLKERGNPELAKRVSSEGFHVSLACEIDHFLEKEDGYERGAAPEEPDERA